ncbi:MAG: hypothetical protein QGG85_01100 [Candidatus Marinimicrobia bacterium]|jgi:hypothetical protein|nr:hypothetical protein [Candidatus Neomarinimicrobiota bacterium]MDP6835788.1 hypothetical protein [Candidatus Neomarinimicrobiota bacterium]|tara:strand:- start:18910 stop:19884 length:975 start_codon:yes stop_codon:yes gene_type:complete
MRFSTLLIRLFILAMCLTSGVIAQEETPLPAPPDTAKPVPDPTAIFKGQIEDLTKQFDDLKKSVQESQEKQEKVEKELETIRGEVSGVADLAREEAAKVSEKIEGSLDEVGGEIERISGDIDEAESSINLFKGQIDTLKDVAQYYYITQRKIPEIDEEILHVLELPELRYKVELKNGTIVVGDIISENLDLIVMQTTVGKLVIEKDFIQRYEERFFTGPRVEFAGNYETRQFPDREEFIGRVKNIGEKRADFVEVTFFLWSSTTESVGSATTLVDGVTTRFRTGVISDASIEPGGTGRFHVMVPKDPGMKVVYRTNEIKWRHYE